jgi:adrenodoxin-NADP+ reductase
LQNCQDRFEEIASSKNFNFIGNINIGYDLPLTSLTPHYDAILFAYGASKDKELGVAGEDLEGVYSARSFVAWYNGLPGSAELKPRIHNGADAVIIGQGNVALDVARILLEDIDRLRKTDIPDYALEALSRNKIKSVRVVGRRGPMQAAFTIKEIREIVKIPYLNFAQIPRDLFPSDVSTLGRPRKRIAELLIKSGKPVSESTLPRFSLDFLLSPAAFNGALQDPSRLASVTFARNEYLLDKGDDDDWTEGGARVHQKSGAPPVEFPASAAFRSIGYKAEPLPGLSDIRVPFDFKRGVIYNTRGRVVQPSQIEHGILSPVSGIYAAGWVKRGPTGVIASTMEDAFQTADAIRDDINSDNSMLNFENGGSTGLGWDGLAKEAQMKDLRRTDWRDWKRIDEVERERGHAYGKEREKITSVAEMLRVLDR